MIRRDDMLDRFVVAKRYAESVEHAAEIMGVSFFALDKALERARAAGDWRGVYKPLTIRTRRKPPLTVLQAWLALPEPRPAYADAADIIDCKVETLRSVVSRARLTGLPTAPPRLTEDILDEWEFLRAGGEHWERAAERLGISPARMKRMLATARAAGDPRGNLTPLEES